MSLFREYVAQHYGKNFVKGKTANQIFAIYMSMIEREDRARKRSQAVKESDQIGYQFQLKDYM